MDQDKPPKPENDLDAALEAILKLPEEDARTAGVFARLHPLLHSREDFTTVEGTTLDPKKIGAWTILERLGEGGMGTVYKAQRNNPVLQTAALKVVKPGNPEVVRRFHKERNILAKLQHPNIAHYLDGGTLPDGRPWLAMEHVSGLRLNVYCHQQNLGLRDRLYLFLKICDALTHAHRHMIIHRDIKPANILVDERGEPRLLDFGIASLLNPETGEQETMTMLHQVMMTPDYASPEQVRHEPLSAASDVYSLGVVLYEMLTYQKPYVIEDRSPLGIIQTVCESPITRPSQVGNGPDQTIATRSLRGDLDNILLMALAREPERRYQSVAEFANDLKSYLKNRPVMARPATVTYRALKFARRHTLLLVTASMLLLGGLAYTVIAHQNQIQLQEEQKRTQAERDRAEEITEYLVSLFEITDPEHAMGEILTADMILEQGRRRIMADLQAKGKTNARLLGILGQVYFGLGQWDQAKTLLHASVEQELEQDGTASFENTLRLSKLYEKLRDQEAMKTWTEKAQQTAQTHQDPTQIALANAQMAVFLDFADQAEAATKLTEETLAALPIEDRYQRERAYLQARLASLYTAENRYDEAKTLLDSALINLDQTGPAPVQKIDILSRQAHLAHSRGDLKQALALRQQLYETNQSAFGPDHPATIRATFTLGNAYRASGKYEQAAVHLEKALDQYKKAYGAEHLKVIGIYHTVAALYKEMGDYAKAEKLFRETVTLWKKAYGPRSKKVTSALDGLGAVLNERGAYDDAQFLYEESLDIREETYGPDHVMTGLSNYNLASHHRRRFRPETALTYINTAQTIFQKQLPDSHWLRGVSDNTQGYIYGMLKRDEEAVPLMVKGFKTLNASKGPGAHHTQDAAKRLAEFYEARNQTAKAKSWRDWLEDPSKDPVD